VHRPKADWERYARRHDPQMIEGRVFLGLKELIELRKQHDAFSGGELEIIRTENDHVLGFVRTCGVDRAVILANFSEAPQIILPPIIEKLPIKGKTPIYGKSTLQADLSLKINPLAFLVFMTN
jgi:amylosucrase